MTVPIYITAAILAVVVAYVSDRVGKRSPFIIVLLCVMIVGFSMYAALTTPAQSISIKLTTLPFSRCISSSNPKVVYGGVFITACSIYPAFPGIISWLANNLAGSYKRSAGMAIQIGIGNLGGVGFLVFSRIGNHVNNYNRPWHPISTDKRTALDTFSVTHWSLDSLALESSLLSL